MPSLEKIFSDYFSAIQEQEQNAINLQLWQKEEARKRRGEIQNRRIALAKSYNPKSIAQAIDPLTGDVDFSKLERLPTDQELKLRAEEAKITSQKVFASDMVQYARDNPDADLSNTFMAVQGMVRGVANVDDLRDAMKADETERHNRAMEGLTAARTEAMARDRAASTKINPYEEYGDAITEIDSTLAQKNSEIAQLKTQISKNQFTTAEEDKWDPTTRGKTVEYRKAEAITELKTLQEEVAQLNSAKKQIVTGKLDPASVVDRMRRVGYAGDHIRAQATFDLWGGFPEGEVPEPSPPEPQGPVFEGFSPDGEEIDDDIWEAADPGAEDTPPPDSIYDEVTPDGTPAVDETFPVTTPGEQGPPVPPLISSRPTSDSLFTLPEQNVEVDSTPFSSVIGGGIDVDTTYPAPTRRGAGADREQAKARRLAQWQDPRILGSRNFAREVIPAGEKTAVAKYFNTMVEGTAETFNNVGRAQRSFYRPYAKLYRSVRNVFRDTTPKPPKHYVS